MEQTDDKTQRAPGMEKDKNFTGYGKVVDMPRAATPDQDEDSQKSCLELDITDDSNDANNDNPASSFSVKSIANFALRASNLSAPRPPRGVGNRTNIVGTGSALSRQAEKTDEPSNQVNLHSTPTLSVSNHCDDSSIHANHGSPASSPRGGDLDHATTAMRNVLRQSEQGLAHANPQYMLASIGHGIQLDRWEYEDSDENYIVAERIVGRGHSNQGPAEEVAPRSHGCICADCLGL